ncbi:hypothetical protein ACVGWW_03035 [Enterobacter hormaechei]
MIFNTNNLIVCQPGQLRNVAKPLPRRTFDGGQGSDVVDARRAKGERRHQPALLTILISTMPIPSLRGA